MSFAVGGRVLADLDFLKSLQDGRHLPSGAEPHQAPSIIGNPGEPQPPVDSRGAVPSNERVETDDKALGTVDEDPGVEEGAQQKADESVATGSGKAAERVHQLGEKLNEIFSEGAHPVSSAALMRKLQKLAKQLSAETSSPKAASGDKSDTGPAAKQSASEPSKRAEQTVPHGSGRPPAKEFEIRPKWLEGFKDFNEKPRLHQKPQAFPLEVPPDTPLGPRPKHDNVDTPHVTNI